MINESIQEAIAQCLVGEFSSVPMNAMLTAKKLLERPAPYRKKIAELLLASIPAEPPK